MEQKAGSQRHEISETLLLVGRTGIDAGSFNVLPDQGEGLRGSLRLAAGLLHLCEVHALACGRGGTLRSLRTRLRTVGKK